VSKIPAKTITRNPITVKEGGWWCRKVSAGCANCYAEQINQSDRFGRGNGLGYSGKPPELVLNREMLTSWKKMRSNHSIFVGSMTDIFGEWIDIDWHFELLDAMLSAPKQTFQLLTKRPQVMLKSIMEWLSSNNLSVLPPNIWVGTTTENQCTFDERVPILLEIPAWIRWLAVEPMLSEIRPTKSKCSLFPSISQVNKQKWGEYLPLHQHIDWVVLGFESGSQARIGQLSWMRSFVQMCQKEQTEKDADLAIYVKQLGSNCWDGKQPFKLKSPRAGGTNIEEFPVDLQIRQMPQRSQ
jgi:protein gp37